MFGNFQDQQNWAITEKNNNEENLNHPCCFFSYRQKKTFSQKIRPLLENFLKEILIFSRERKTIEHKTHLFEIGSAVD